MKYFVLIAVAVAAVAGAPVEESGSKAKRGILSAPLLAPAPILHAAPLALSAPILHSAPLALPAIHSAPLALPAIHAAPIISHAPLFSAPLALGHGSIFSGALLGHGLIH